MKCTNPELSKFALLSDQEPDEKLTESVREHLAVCPACAERRERYDTWLNLLKLKSRSQHLETETLLAYDDGQLTSEEQLRADAHLRSCQKCSDELDRIKSAFDALGKDELDISHSVPGWTTERKQAFVASMKRELQVSGQLLTEESTTKKAAARAQTISTSRQLRVRALRWGWSLGFALITVVIGTIFFFRPSPDLSTKITNGPNQNLTVQTTPGSPSPTASANQKTNQAAQQRVRPSANKAINQSSPELPQQADLEMQEIDMVIDSTRTAGERQAISISRPNLRFLISIPRSAVSRSFLFELIDEDKGIRVKDLTLMTTPKRDHRELRVELPANELSGTLYTLRLTGTNKADKTPEVFTLYLKLER